MAEIKLVKMIRPFGDSVGPTECDVHPDEVENYAAGGWVVEATYGKTAPIAEPEPVAEEPAEPAKPVRKAKR